MAILDNTAAHFEYINSLPKMNGYSVEEIKKLSFTGLTHPDDLTKDVDLFNRLIDMEIKTIGLKKDAFFKINGIKF